MADLMSDEDMLAYVAALNRARMSGRLPIQPQRDSLRSANTPAGDWLAQATGSPALGAAGSTAERGGRAGLDLMGDVAMQPARAGQAVIDAAGNPTIPNLTNAGAQVGMTLLRPGMILKSLGAGYGAAAAKDAGLFDMIGTPAEAQSASQSRARAGAAKAEAAAAAAKAKAKAKAEAEILRATTEAEAQRAQIEKDKASDLMARQEFERGVLTAEEAKNKELAKKDQSFQNTEIGRVYDKTGGFAPMALGTAGGLIHRMATGPAKGAMDKYVLPMIEGSALTYAGLNAPMVYDALNTPIRNPEKMAYEAYARELPASHPQRAYWEQYAKDRPEQNPINARAWEQLTDPMQQGKRMLTAIAEGAPAGLLGRNLPEASRAAVEGVGMLPGTLMTGYQKGMASADAAKLARLKASQEMAVTRAEIDAALAEARIRAASRVKQAEGATPMPIEAPMAAPVLPMPPPTGNLTPAERARSFMRGR